VIRFVAMARKMTESGRERSVMSAGGLAPGWLGKILDLYRYVWRTSGRAQILLSALSVGLFLLELAPLELQRRIVNTAVEKQAYRTIALLCGIYLLVALAQGGLKLTLNVYRGSVIETVSKRMRLDPNLMAVARSEEKNGAEDQGVAISIVTSEVEAVGGFVGTSFSDPILNGGILLSVFGYMIFMQPWMALAALALFIPQVFFIPVLQAAINRRTAERIRTVRALAVDIVDRSNAEAEQREKTYRSRVSDVYRLNMQIYRRKFGMNFLMNLLYQFGVVGVLAVGGWFLMRGETQVGTVVAFVSGLARTNDPWNDLVDFFRNLANAGVKYALIAQVLTKGGAADGALLATAAKEGRP
jgi:ABC-type multidrug transport system fused ATPase/permease subunit